MAIRKSTTLELTREGYEASLVAEPLGLLLEFVEFRVAKDSQPSSRSSLWGTEVYRGRISDYELIGNNCLLFTCAVPAEIDAGVLDSLALMNADGVIMAQDFIASRRKEQSATAYIYAYINMPTAIEPIELEVKTRWTFPQVHTYSDLPPANLANRFEYIVNNGHCGAREHYPEFLPTMVMVGSPDPKTLVYPPAEPFTDPDIGTLAPGTYTYAVTATGGSGESMSSPTHSIELSQLQPPAVYIDAADGHLQSGTHYYQVVAVGPGNGKTLPSTELSIAVVKLATPAAPSVTEIVSGGGLNAGTYYYALSALSANGETLISTVVNLTVADDAGVEVSWASVAGAIGYNLYRGTSPSTLRLLLQADASEAVALDWGKPTSSQLPVPIATDCGAKILWDKVEDAIGYEVYGRSVGAGKTLVAAVADDVFFYVDKGNALLPLTMPVTNTTATGVEVKWSKVPGATGYNIYGRVAGSLGLIGTVGDVNAWVDDGSEAPGTAPPAVNTTAAVEWQLVDGTLLVRAATTAVSADSFAVAGFTYDNQDLAFATFTTGDAQHQIRHIRWDSADNRFVNIDAPWNPAPDIGDTVAVWAAPGCCGGVCPEYEEEELVWSPPPAKPPTAPKWAFLGVHICGVFLGAQVSGSTPSSAKDKAWATRKNSEYVDSGLLDYIFCNEAGRTDLVTVIDNVIQTPKGNRAPVGDYSSIAQSFAHAVKCTIDSIAIPAGLRVIIYRNQNFTGDVIFDQEGPFYMVNGVWRSQSDFRWALDAGVWADATVQEIIPESCRYWSDDDMRDLWKNGSMQIVRTYSL